MDLSWIIFALIFSVFSIITMIAEERFPGRMLRLLFLMRFFGFLAFLPIVFFLTPPSDPVFYLATLGSGILFAYSDLILAGLTSKNGAGAVARVEPLSAWMLFFVWMALSPSLFMAYLDAPLRLAGIVAALSGCVYFSLRLRKCNITWPVIKRIAPAIIIIVLGTSCSKTAMVHSDFHEGIWYYCLIQSGFITLVYTVLFRLKTIPGLGDLDMRKDIPERFFTKRAATYGAVSALGLFLAQSSKYYAISLSDNPAYVTVFGLLAPFWILLVYRAIGRQEKADVVSGFGIVVSTAVMVLFTQI